MWPGTEKEKKLVNTADLALLFKQDFGFISYAECGFTEDGGIVTRTLMDCILFQPNLENSAHKILHAIRFFYLRLWLDKTNFTFELLEKYKSHVVFGNCGAFNTRRWKEFLNPFIVQNVGRIDLFLNEKIPQTYKKFATSLNETLYTPAQVSDLNAMPDENFFELVTDIEIYLESLASLQGALEMSTQVAC